MTHNLDADSLHPGAVRRMAEHYAKEEVPFTISPRYGYRSTKKYPKVRQDVVVGEKGEWPIGQRFDQSMGNVAVVILGLAARKPFKINFGHSTSAFVTRPSQDVHVLECSGLPLTPISVGQKIQFEGLDSGDKVRVVAEVYPIHLMPTGRIDVTFGAKQHVLEHGVFSPLTTNAVDFPEQLAPISMNNMCQIEEMFPGLPKFDVLSPMMLAHAILDQTKNPSNYYVMNKDRRNFASTGRGIRYTDTRVLRCGCNTTIPSLDILRSITCPCPFGFSAGNTGRTGSFPVPCDGDGAGITVTIAPGLPPTRDCVWTISLRPMLPSQVGIEPSPFQIWRETEQEFVTTEGNRGKRTVRKIVDLKALELDLDEDEYKEKLEELDTDPGVHVTLPVTFLMEAVPDSVVVGTRDMVLVALSEKHVCVTCAPRVPTPVPAARSTTWFKGTAKRSNKSE